MKHWGKVDSGSVQLHVLYEENNDRLERSYLPMSPQLWAVKATAEHWQLWKEAMRCPGGLAWHGVNRGTPESIAPIPPSPSPQHLFP